MEELWFWGKIFGEENDYYITLGINYHGQFEFPQKKFYFTTNSTFSFVPLPETYEYHDKDFLNSYYKGLKGVPNTIINRYQEEVPPDDGSGNAGSNQPLDEILPDDKKVVNPDDLDKSTITAPKVEEKKENFTESLKLAYLVKNIDFDTNVVPQGAFRLIPEHELRRNQSFKGLSPDELLHLDKFLHFRPISESKRELVESDEAIFRFDLLDSIADDKVKGSWSIQLDSTKKVANIRSLLWPGYFAVHKANTNFFCGCYFGNGMKNAELPFMI
jgi:radial spoke head protein 9